MSLLFDVTGAPLQGVQFPAVLVCSTVLDLCAERVYQPTSTQRFDMWSFLTASVISAREGTTAGFESPSKCSFHHPTVSLHVTIPWMSDSRTVFHLAEKVDESCYLRGQKSEWKEKKACILISGGNIGAWVGTMSHIRDSDRHECGKKRHDRGEGLQMGERERDENKSEWWRTETQQRLKCLFLSPFLCAISERGRR